MLNNLEVTNGFQSAGSRELGFLLDCAKQSGKRRQCLISRSQFSVYDLSAFYGSFAHMVPSKTREGLQRSTAKSSICHERKKNYY